MCNKDKRLCVKSFYVDHISIIYTHKTVKNEETREKKIESYLDLLSFSFHFQSILISPNVLGQNNLLIVGVWKRILFQYF